MRNKARKIAPAPWPLSSGSIIQYSRSMRCDVCGSSDSVFFIKPDGSDGELRMCRSCAAARGYASTDEGQGAPSASTACPACGWTADRLKSSGRLGCPRCAVAFRREILAILRRSGRTASYEGRTPGTAPEDVGRPAAADARAGELAEAIRDEDFERAAAIRDGPEGSPGRQEP
jgi:protein arginine kinase activator